MNTIVNINTNININTKECSSKDNKMYRNT